MPNDLDPIQTPLTAPINTQLNSLAEELAYNYFSNSFGEKEFEKEGCLDMFSDPAIKEKFTTKFGKGERVRNILIVGAGASNDSFASIPLGKAMTEEMKATYGDKIETEFVKRKYEHEKEEIAAMTGKENLSFENYFYLLSNHFVEQEELRKKIKEMTNIRYAPCLFNEIVAHLLKHSFIDVVINFNFEETLDQSIADEIGSENYYNVISDGHAVSIDKILIGGRLKSPIYIKPHGSNSHKSTLRFTNNHYFDMPADIKSMLETLFKGRINDDKKIEKVNLIVVGFSLESVEFNKLLRIRNEEKQTEFPDYEIYHIDINPFLCTVDPEKPLPSRDLGFATHFPSLIIDHPSIEEKPNYAKKIKYTPIKVENKPNENCITTPLGELMSVLWRKVHRTFQHPFSPRSIARHEILNYFLYDKECCRKTSPDKDGNTIDSRAAARAAIYTMYEPPEEIKQPADYCKYLLDKLMIELMLSINRNNGLIDLLEILKGRVGDYYNLYKEYQATNSYSIYEIADELCGSAKTSENEPPFLKNSNYYLLYNEFEAADSEPTKIISQFSATLKEQLGKENEERIDKLTKTLAGEYEKLASNNKVKTRVITLLMRLLTSRKTCPEFKLRLLKNFDQPVFNGREENKVPLFNEVIRSMAKGIDSHYYIINPRQNNPIHHMFETYTKDCVQHTNLAYIHEFSRFFSKADKWDTALIVAETGAIFDFLAHEKTTPHIKEKKSYWFVVMSA
jgi:hypothetical protein